MRTSPYHLLTGRLILCKSSLTVKKIWRRAGSKFSIGSPPSFSTGSTGTAAVLNGLRTAFPLNSGDKLTPMPLTRLCKYHSRRSRCSNESWAMFGTSAGLKSESRLNSNRPHWLSPLAQWSCILGGLMFNRIGGRSHHCVNTFLSGAHNGNTVKLEHKKYDMISRGKCATTTILDWNDAWNHQFWKFWNCVGLLVD